jgi:hypothetical protein
MLLSVGYHSGTSSATGGVKTKIRRPPNSFFVFANEKRREIAAQYPTERNQQISTRLGNLWKSLQNEDKERYVKMACQLGEEHKKKYPEYVYSPKVMRLQKALRVEARQRKLATSRSTRRKPARSCARISQQSDIKVFLENCSAEDCSISDTEMSSGLLVLQDTAEGFQAQVGQNMYQRCITAHQQTAPQNWDCAVSSELNGPQWLSYIQAPQPNVLDTTPANGDTTIQECDAAAQHMTGVHQQRDPCHLMTPQQVTGSPYRSSMRTSPENSEPTAATDQIMTHSTRHVGDGAGSDQQHLPHDPALPQALVTTDEWGLTRNPDLPHQLLEDDPVLPQVIPAHEDTEMLDTIPISLENSMNLPALDLLDTADFLQYCLRLSDADSEKLAYEAVLAFDRLWN